jgi:hypothetical protein
LANAAGTCVIGIYRVEKPEECDERDEPFEEELLLLGR